MWAEHIYSRTAASVYRLTVANLRGLEDILLFLRAPLPVQELNPALLRDTIHLKVTVGACSLLVPLAPHQLLYEKALVGAREDDAPRLDFGTRTVVGHVSCGSRRGGRARRSRDRMERAGHPATNASIVETKTDGPLYSLPTPPPEAATLAAAVDPIGSRPATTQRREGSADRPLRRTTNQRASPSTLTYV